MTLRRWVLLALFAALPLANTLTLDVGFPITISHVLVVVLAGIQLLEIRTGRMGISWLPATLFVAFCVIYATSAIVSLGSTLPTFEWATGRNAPTFRSITKVVWLFGNVLACVVVATEIRRQRASRPAMQAMVVGAVASSAYGFYQVLGQSHGFFVPLLPGTEFIEGTASFWIVPRAKSTFLEPSFFGAYLAVVLPFAMACFPRTMLTVIAVTAILVGIIVTFSIAGWLSVAVGGLIVLGLAIPSRGWRWAMPFTAAGLAAAFVVLIAIPGMPRAAVALMDKGAIASTTVLGETDGNTVIPIPGPDGEPPEAVEVSAAERVATTRAAIAMFMSSPLLGVGPGNFGFRYAEFRPEGTAQPDQLLITNNIYAELLAEAGLLGFISFLAAMAVLGSMVLRELLRSTGAMHLQLEAGAGALGALLASYLVAPSFTILYQWAVIGLIVALVVARHEGRSEGL